MIEAWDRTIRLRDVWEDNSYSFEERRDIIVDRLRESGWLQDWDYTLDFAITDLANSTTQAEFNTAWGFIYDYSDADLVWISI